MTAVLRRDVICLFLKNSSSLCKSSVSVSASLHFYSTSRQLQPVINPTVFDFLLHKHHFSPEAASQVASVLNRLRNTEKSDSILSFLKESGFSNTQLEKIVKYSPSLISSNLEELIKPKIKVFQDLGFTANDIGNMMANNPSILRRSANNSLIPSFSVLRDLVGSDAEVVNLVRRSGWFVGKDLEKTLVPNIEILKSRSVPMEQIIRCMHSFSRFLLIKPKIMRKCVDKVEEMGVKRGSKMFIHAARVIGSMSDEAWERKLQAFRSLGFSEDDILKGFRKSPPAFAVSVKKMKKVEEVVVSSGKYNMACIVSHPLSLIYSIQKRYKPRLQVLAILENRNLITKVPSFTTMLHMSNKGFFEKFVNPYIDEVGHVFMANSATSGKGEVKHVPST